jgi:2-polyprenyl-3-methyl-5-hydroxy-6-metoxy-1,4-benzoquinol methylase
LIIASEVLEYIPDPGALLEEIVRILRPAGLLWATTPKASGARVERSMPARTSSALLSQEYEGTALQSRVPTDRVGHTCNEPL